MSKNLPNMLDGTLEKLRQMVDGNSIIGDAIHVGEDVTVIPISKISLGVAGGGADYVSKHPNNQENPFGGGCGGGCHGGGCGDSECGGCGEGDCGCGCH